MTCRYFAVFDTSDSGFGSLTFATSGKSDLVVAISSLTDTTVDASKTSSLFTHHQYGLGNTLGLDLNRTSQLDADFGNDSFLTVLNARIATLATAATWSAPPTVAFSWTTGYYTFTHGTLPTSMVISNAATRKLFGLASLSYADIRATPAVSTLVPHYMIVPTMDGVSFPTSDYEIDDVTSLSIAGDGRVFQLSRDTVALCRDWVQQFETKEKTLRLSAATAHPFTFQELFDQCKRGFPFIVSDGFTDSYDEAFYLKDAQWKPTRAAPDSDTPGFHINFEAIVMGEVKSG